jgi:hypothetical protein
VRVAPDDDVYRVNAVWLGPRGLTFPWTARYLAYATWLLSFLVVILFEAATPIDVGVPPVWEICLTTLFTYAVMGFVDHERPVRAVWQSFAADLSAPRPRGEPTVTRTLAKVRVRERHERRSGRRRGRVPAAVPEHRVPRGTRAARAARHQRDGRDTGVFTGPVLGGHVTTREIHEGEVLHHDRSRGRR